MTKAKAKPKKQAPFMKIPPREDTTVGDVAITSPGVDIQLSNGCIYTMRRLSAMDWPHMARLIRDIFGRGVIEVGLRVKRQEDIFTPDGLSTILLMGLPACENTVMEFIADLLGVTTDDLADPEKFPLDGIIDIVEALDAHPDVAAFLARAHTLRTVLVGQWQKAISTIFPESPTPPTA